MAKKRRSSQFKDSSQVIDIEEARKRRQEKRKKQKKQAQEAQGSEKKPVRASIKAARRRRNLISAVIILAIIAAVGMSIYNIVALKAEQKQVRQEQQQLKEERDRLKEQLDQSADPVFIEDQAREALRLVDPGETIYVFPDAGETETTETKAAESE